MCLLVFMKHSCAGTSRLGMPAPLSTFLGETAFWFQFGRIQSSRSDVRSLLVSLCGVPACHSQVVIYKSHETVTGNVSLSFCLLRQCWLGARDASPRGCRCSPSRRSLYPVTTTNFGSSSVFCAFQSCILCSSSCVRNTKQGEGCRPHLCTFFLLFRLNIFLH